MKTPNVGRNVFDLSHEKKLSCDMGKLIPVMCEEIMPGDYFKTDTSFVVRINPLLAPMMHRVDVFCHYFFVPLRLLWTNFESFIGGGPAGTDATVHPYIAFAGPIAFESLPDYFGVSPLLSGATPPVSLAYGAPINVSALPFRAYAKIYNEWYRDQTNQTVIAQSMGDGADATTNTTLLNRCWESDRFTGALPWTQRGAAVTIPLGTTAPVVRVSNAATGWRAYQEGNNTVAAAGDAIIDGSGDITNSATRFTLDPQGGLQADLTAASPATINALREAFQIQKWLERNARGGARYVEIILNHFGIRSSDARLQRPEFLGGGRSPVVVSEVLQTSEAGATPQGTMAGHGFSVQSGHAFERQFEEHGFVIGLMSIMPRTAYYQGLNPMWSRTTRYDYPWPEFAHLGEIAIKNKELYVQGTAADELTFGYTGRYDEYRSRESSVHGTFRSTLDYWHMGRRFTALPTLGSTFVTSDPTRRINAVTSVSNCLVQVHNNVRAVRPLPLEGTPGSI